mgnify:CR=1 FL=1
MNSRRFSKAWWLPGFASLLVMHAILAGQYRVAMMIQPAWLAYALMGLAMVACALPWWPLLRWNPHANGGGANAAADHMDAPGRWTVRMAGAALIAFAVAGLVARGCWIHRLPIAPELGDMLPQIQQAIHDWMSGIFPYRVHFFPWPIHLPYPPALWEAYIPATLAGVDLRYTTLVCLAIMGAIWFMQFRGFALRRIPVWQLWAWTLLAGMFFLSPLILRFVIQGHTAPYWLALTALPVLLHCRQNAASAVVLGLVCAMRQPAILFVPILGWYWWRAFSWRRAVLLVGIAAATSLLIYGPFLVKDPVAVLWTPMRQYATVGRETFEFNPAMILECIGFSNLFYLAGQDRFLTLAALGGFAIVLAGNAKRMKTPADATRIMALATLGFALFSPIPFYYEYIPALILFMQAWWQEVAASAGPLPSPQPAVKQ